MSLGLPSLERMIEEAGASRVREWKVSAQKSWEVSSYIMTNPEAHHSFVYQEVYQMYLRYRSVEASHGK